MYNKHALCHIYCWQPLLCMHIPTSYCTTISYTLDINIDTRKDIKVHEVKINILYENKYTKLTGH